MTEMFAPKLLHISPIDENDIIVMRERTLKRDVLHQQNTFSIASHSIYANIVRNV